MKEEYEQKMVDYMRGKKAGHVVWDEKGDVILNQGDTITDEAIERARNAGRLHYTMLAAASTVIGSTDEDAKLRHQEFRDVTEGHEADFVRGRTVPRDIRDFHGNLVCRTGDTITDELIDMASEHGVLQELVLAVGAPGLHLGDYERCSVCAADKAA